MSKPPYTDLQKECTLGNIENVERILENQKRDGKFIETWDTTPLVMAAGRGYLEIVKLLLNYGYHLTSFSEKGKTALNYAVAYGREEVVKFILENGPPLNSPIYQTTYNYPLYQAAENGYVGVVKLLLEQTEKRTVIFQYGTPIFAATEKGFYKVVKELLEHGGQLEIVNSYPLHIAVEKR